MRSRRSPGSRGRNLGLVGADELQCHDRDVRGDADHADAVQRCCDRARDVGPMSVLTVVVDAVVVVAEVPAVDVVDVAVAVIVDPVGFATVAQFAGVRPRAFGEVGMGEVDAIIDERDDRRRVTGRDAERLAGVDVGIGRALRSGIAAALAQVLESPQLVPQRLAGRVRIKETSVVDAHAEDIRVGLKSREHVACLPGRGLEGDGPGIRQVLGVPGACRVHRRRARGGRRAARNVTIRLFGSSAVGRCHAGPTCRSLGVAEPGDAAWAGITTTTARMTAVATANGRYAERAGDI